MNTVILCPIFFKKDSSDENPNDDDKNILKSFILKPVFDFSQTQEFNKYESEIYDNKTIIDFNTTLSFIKNNFKDIVINIKDINERGFYNPLNKEITINNEKNPYTLLHEFSHFLTNDIKDIKDITIKGNYAKNEIIAELTSFLILKKFFNQNEFNFNYSNIWTSNLNEFNINEFNKLLNKVLMIINNLKGGI